MKIKFLNFLIIVLIVGGLVIQWFNFTSRIKLAAHPVFGVTFSRFKAEELKLDWRETYLAILDDLKVKHLRLGAYWDDIETQSGQYDFSNLDWQIEEAEKHGAQIILAIGFRLPGPARMSFTRMGNELVRKRQASRNFAPNGNGNS